MAKEYNNVIEKHLLDIPIDNVKFHTLCQHNITLPYDLQVSIPGLHLSLGIFNRLWTLLEEACTSLDLRLAEENHGPSGTGGHTFNEYSIVLEQRSSLKVQLESQVSHAELLEQLATYLSLSVPDPEQSEPLKAVRNEAAIARIRADKMVYNLILLQ